MLVSYILIAFIVVVSIFALYILYAFRTGAPFWPSNKQTVAKMLALAEAKEGQLLIDLGSGDGRIVRAAAKLGLRAIGVEMNPFFVWWSRLRLWLYRVGRVQIVRGDLWKTDVGEADIVTIYFIYPKMIQLRDKLRREMKPGSKIISNKFTFPDWIPEANDGKVYLYVLHSDR